MKAIFLVMVLIVACSGESVRQNFQGEWLGVSGDAQLFIDDNMIFYYSDSDNKKVNIGNADVSLGKVVFKMSDFCNNNQGDYYYEIYRDTLQLRVITDNCLNRKAFIDNIKFLKQK